MQAAWKLAKNIEIRRWKIKDNIEIGLDIRNCYVI